MRWGCTYFFLCNLRSSHLEYSSFLPPQKKAGIEGKHEMILLFTLHFNFVKLRSLMFLKRNWNKPIKNAISRFLTIVIWLWNSRLYMWNYFIIWRLFINKLFNVVYCHLGNNDNILEFLQIILLVVCQFLINLIRFGPHIYNINVSHWEIALNLNKVMHFEKGLYVWGRGKSSMMKRHTMYWVYKLPRNKLLRTKDCYSIDTFLRCDFSALSSWDPSTPHMKNWVTCQTIRNK